MKKRHVYDLVILLAAGTIMMSACGKNQMRLLIQQRPHRPKARLRLPQRKPPNQTKLHPKHRSRKIQKAQNSICSRERLQKQKRRLCLYLTGR